MTSKFSRAVFEFTRNTYPNGPPYHNLPVIFLISSRPEPDIKVMFDSAELVNLWDSLVLYHSLMPSDDIRLFLNDSFRIIRDTHPLKEHIPPLWPTMAVRLGKYSA